MTPTRTWPILYSTLFAALILALAFGAAWRLLQTPAPTVPLDLLSGQAAKAFESRYDEHFPIKRLGINLWAAIELRLFGEGRRGVVVGDKGWLYTDEEFRPYPDDGAWVSRRIAEIADVQQQLASDGIALVVALLPAKARIYPEHRHDHRPAAIHRNLYAEARSALLERAVTAPDLLATLEACAHLQPVFLRTDTHWTPAGADCAASAIADTVRRLGKSTSAPLRYFTDADAERAYRGDLMSFLPLEPWFAELLPAPDRLAQRHTRPEQEVELLADTAAAEVIVIGTSYSADPAWNFTGALQQALAEDVLNHAESGQGPFVPMQRYLRSLREGAAPPRLLIWEIPERYLPMPDRSTPIHPSLTLAAPAPEISA